MSWVSPGRFVFFSGFGRALWATGLAWRSLAPWGQSFVCERVPWAVGGAGLYLYQPHRVSSARPVGWGKRWLRWEELADLRTDGSDLHARGRGIYSASSPLAARRLAVELTTLRDAAPAARERVGEGLLRAGLDLVRLDAVLAAVAKETRLLRGLSTVLFAYVAGVVVALISIEESILLWPWLLGGFGLVLLSVVSEFFMAHQRLDAGTSGERWARVVTMLMSFPMACKATDALTRDLLAGFQPLAVAHRLCAPANFAALARAELLALDYPGSETWRDAEPELRAVQDAARARLRDILAAELERWGVDVARITAPASPEPGSRAYCPRCGTSYAEAAERCADCGVELRSVA